MVKGISMLSSHLSAGNFRLKNLNLFFRHREPQLKMTALRSCIRHYRLFRTTTTTTATSPLTATLTPSPPSESSPPQTSETEPNLSDREIKRLALVGRFSDVRHIVESRKKDPRITDELYFSTLIRSYGVAGMLGLASRLFEEMEHLGTPRTSISFNALLHAYTMERKFHQVPKLFYEITQKYDFSPDEKSYNFLIKALFECDSLESALSKLEEMEEKKIEITTVTYTTVLGALYKKEEIEKADKLWDQMIERGCKPNVGVYNARMARAQFEKPQDVLKLFNEMARDDVKPDITSYNYLFTCYSRNDMVEEARNVYRDLEKNGCAPNGTTYRLHIFHLCKTGDFEKGYEVFKESVKVDNIPAFRILRKLVEGLLEISKIEETKEMLMIIKQKFPNYYVKAWKPMEVRLGLSTREESPTEEGSPVNAGLRAESKKLNSCSLSEMFSTLGRI